MTQANANSRADATAAQTTDAQAPVGGSTAPAPKPTTLDEAVALMLGEGVAAKPDPASNPPDASDAPPEGIEAESSLDAAQPEGDEPAGENVQGHAVESQDQQAEGEGEPAPSANEVNQVKTLFKQLKEQGLNISEVKRINGVLAERKRLEERVAQLENGKGTVPQTPTGPLQNVFDPQQLEGERQKAEDGMEFAEQLLGLLPHDPDHVESQLRKAMGKSAEEGDFSPRAMAQMLNTAKSNFRGVLRAVPQRQQYLQGYQQVRQHVEQAFPWVNDPADERSAMYSQLLSQVPEFKARSASHEYWIASAVRGHLETQRELKAKAAGNGQRSAPKANGAAPKPVFRSTSPSTGSNGTAPPRMNPAAAKIKAASDRVTLERSSDALGEFLQATGFGV